MLKDFFVKIAVFIGAIVAIFTFGYFRGKDNEKNKQNNQILQNAKISKERQLKRRFDDIAAVRIRMQKYLRK